jgi:hypothetical protein
MRLRLTHLGCGKAIRPLLACSRLRRRGASAFTCEPVPGPGAGLEPGAAPRAHRRATAALQRERAPGLPHRNRPRARRPLDGDDHSGRLFLGDRRFGALRDVAGASPQPCSPRGWPSWRSSASSAATEGGYRLARKGVDMFPIVAQMIRWGDRWLAGAAGAPLLLRHAGCGACFAPDSPARLPRGAALGARCGSR